MLLLLVPSSEEMAVAVEGSKSNRKVGQGDDDPDWFFNVKVEKVRIVGQKIGAWVQAELDCCLLYTSPSLWILQAEWEH